MATESVSDRIEHAQTVLTPTQMAIGLLMVTAIGATVLFLQEPMVHEAMHNVRHVTGMACH